MNTGTFTDLLACWPELCKLVGLTEAHTGRIYGVKGYTVGKAKAVDPTKEPGWVSYQWEEADEMWLDGKLLWRSVGNRYYNTVAVLVEGKVQCYAMSNDGELYAPEGEQKVWPLISLVREYKWVREV